MATATTTATTAMAESVIASAPGGPRPAYTDVALVEAARLMLARMGLRPEDLLTDAPLDGAVVSGGARGVGGARVPTFGEYIETLMQVRPPGFDVYKHYWNRITATWSERRLDEVTPSDIERFITAMRDNDVIRTKKNYRGGRVAAMHAVSAFRSLYNRAENDGLITPAQNAARRVAKPRRAPSSRQAIPDARLAEINEVIATTGDDPALDSLIQRIHIETACRRGGVLALRARDLDEAQCLVMLREKGGTTRSQPVSPTLMRHLLAHAAERGGAVDPSGPLLRYRSGRPVGSGRYEYIWGRVGKHLPWVAAQHITAHWLRHTTITWVERAFGEAVARAYAGHAEKSGSEASTTSIYTKATLGEVAAALSLLTGEPHPLAEAVDTIFTDAITTPATSPASDDPAVDQCGR
jgi:integrase/recombinase XerC